LFRKPKKIKINFGDSSLIISKEGRIELVHLTILKYFIKHCLRVKKNSLEVNEKIWYFGNLNFFLQKKSKNSRMGKGKGMLDRAVMRVKKNFILFEFKGYSIYRLNKLCINVNKKLSLGLYTISKNNNTYPMWCKNNFYLHYFDKYLLY